jgi:hypothetical protein
LVRFDDFVVAVVVVVKVSDLDNAAIDADVGILSAGNEFEFFFSGWASLTNRFLFSRSWR